MAGAPVQPRRRTHALHCERVSELLKTLQLPDARRIVAAAQAKAAELKASVTVAVVDAGGHMLAFERMQGAPISSIDGAMRKAWTAAIFAADSADLARGASGAAATLDVSHWTDARALFVAGGIALRQDRVVVGAVGICGGPGAHDQEIAQNAADAF